MREFESEISGWGRFPVTKSFLVRPERYSQLSINDKSYIPRGLGASYGDAAMNTNGRVVLMERMNRFLSFEVISGILRVEAGVSLKEILDFSVIRGWMLPVTPGTKRATLGGCIAADVHGKNHHVDGTIGNYVRALELVLPDGTRRRCSPKQDAELFWATIGGMGLTGIITEVSIQLIQIESAYMSVKHYDAKNIEDAIQLLQSNEHQDKYSVAWIDCLARGKHMGRGVVMNAHHAALNELPHDVENPFKIEQKQSLSFPFQCISPFLNSFTIKAFNAFYYRLQRKKTAPFITDYNSYFYPLDILENWNRLYGKKGFIQYQFVVPEENALKEILELISHKKIASFLAVLKRFGNEGRGMLSFPQKGYTLALDIPASYPSLFPFLDQLDRMVIDFKVKVYLAKDCRMSPTNFKEMYPRFSEWLKIKQSIDPQNLIISDLSKRLQMERL